MQQLPPSLCIDLGASFTKIAFRESPDATSHLLRKADLPDEHHFCIPSVAARNTARDAWVFGVDAMDLKSGSRVQVFQNWKADLFEPEEEREVGFDVLDGASDEARALLLDNYPALRALDVATRYLKWLNHEQIPAMLGHSRHRDAEVQLCVPDFVLDDPLATRLEQIMRDVGFRNPGVYALSEPKANLIGILTEGQNALTQGGRPNLGAMFGSAEVLRTLARADQAVLIIDVGAFTTDLALASFAHRTGSGFDEDPSLSVRLGVRRLDEWILEAAPDEERMRVESSASEREHFHATVHGGVAGPRPEEVGLTSASVDAAVSRFTQEIVKAVDGFLDDHGTDSLYAAVLTGGGSNIPGIANRLAAALGEKNLGALHAPRTTEAPARLKKYSLRPELVRGASAVGGASILFRV